MVSAMDDISPSAEKVCNSGKQLSEVEGLLRDQIEDGLAPDLVLNTDISNSNRDSGIQDGECLELPPINEIQKTRRTADPVEDVADAWSRRGSVVGNYSVQTTDSMETDPNDELCGWGPFSPKFCQRFRNPKWVLVWLSMAGVCQVGSCYIISRFKKKIKVNTTCAIL